MNYILARDEFVEVGATEPLFVVTAAGLPHQRVRVLNLARDEEEVVKASELRARVSAGELEHRRPGAPRVSPPMQQDPALEKATATAMAQVSRIHQYSERFRVSINQAYQAVRKAHALAAGGAAATCFPSRATMYRHLAAMRNGRPVLCGNANKGNRTPRYSEQVTELITEIVKSEHQKPDSRWTINAVTKYCNLQAHTAGLLPHERRISRKFVQRVLFTRLSSDPETARLLPQLRAAEKSIAKHTIRVHGFLQRVEQDALHLPFSVQTPAGEVRDMYLVHAIDVATGLPVGWAFSVGTPNAATSLACVESILYSKKARLAELDVQMDADVYGAPGCIVFDNGSEAKNERISGLVRLGIEVHYCKSRHPQDKPFIERLNRALKESLETLPGCTRKDGKDGSRDPVALGDRPMSMEELERWIVRWYYEDWALRPLDRLVRSDFTDAAHLGATPLARYVRMERDGCAMPLPPNPDDWRRVKCTQMERTLARTTGVTVDGYHFRGAQLERLIARFGSAPVDVLVDPDDFRMVHVVDGNELVVLVNADVSESTPALSFSQAKAREQAERNAALADGAATSSKFKADVFAASVTQSKGKAGRAAAKQVRKQVKHAQAVERTRERPLPSQGMTDLSAATDAFSVDQLPELLVVDRKTGEAL